MDQGKAIDQNKQAGAQRHNLGGDAIELGRNVGSCTENATCKSEAKCQGSIEAGDRAFLEGRPVLGVLRVVWSIPSDDVITLARRVSRVYSGSFFFIPLLWSRVAFLNVSW